MNDSEPSNHWDSLAEQLGAEPPPPEPNKQAAAEGPDEAEIESREAATPNDLPAPSDLAYADEAEDSLHADALEPQPPARPKPAPRKSEKPSPADWNSIAGELGIEVPDEPVAEVEPQPEVGDAEMADDTRGDSAPVDLDTLLSAAPDSAADEPVAIDDESSGSQTARRAASLEFGFGIIDAIDTRDQSFIEEAEDAVNAEPDDESYEPAAPKPEPTTPEDETARAAEDDEDQRDAPDTATPDDKTRRRKRRRGRKRRPRDRQGDERREPAAEGSSEPTGQPSPDTSDTDAETATVPSDSGRGAESQGPSRKRRRPRRRPIVGIPDVEHPAEVSEDQVAPIPPEDEQPTADRPSESEPDSDAAPEQEKRPRKGRRQREPAAESSGDSSGEPESGRPSHRKIPSWAEAIGMVISTNEQARARAPDGGSRRRGRGKGRRPNRGKKS